MEKLVSRDLYMARLLPYIDAPLIKVITGIRRCGKSSILLLLVDILKKRGVPDSHIIHINFEDMNYMDIRSARALHDHLKAALSDEGRYYVLLDEIQEVVEWERVVNSLLLDGKTDIYITGSNSRLLSSELATYIAGRYLEIPVKPLSFDEYRLFKRVYTGDNASITSDFRDFIRVGGFPVTHIANYSHEEIYRIVNDIYASVILRDVVQRHKIRNVELLERIVRFVFDNVGNTFSAQRVADYFKAQQRRVDLETIYNYLAALSGAFITRRLARYDIKGKEILKTNEKYYLGDHSLLYAVMGYKDRMIAGVLENIVLHELERRGYTVFVGKLDTREIDFIAERHGELIYVQVAYQIATAGTAEREFTPLLQVQDQYPKYVLSLDDFWKDSIDGVKYKSIPEFLLMEAW
jgi:predicted AAA+ superfamily ATPase